MVQILGILISAGLQMVAMEEFGGRKKSKNPWRPVGICPPIAILNKAFYSFPILSRITTDNLYETYINTTQEMSRVASISKPPDRIFLFF